MTAVFKKYDAHNSGVVPVKDLGVMLKETYNVYITTSHAQLIGGFDKDASIGFEDYQKLAAKCVTQDEGLLSTTHAQRSRRIIISSTRFVGSQQIFRHWCGRKATSSSSASV